MDETTIRTKAEAFIAALHALEHAESESDDLLDSLVGLYADDAALTNSALRLTGEEMTGTDAIRNFWSEYKKTVGKANSDFKQITVNGEAAGLFWTTDGITTPDQPTPMSYDGTTLLVFNEAGNIRHFQGYYDTHQFNRTIGREH